MINPRELFQRLLSVRRDRELCRAFHATFCQEDGRLNAPGSTVLAHLRAYCHADLSTLVYSPDGKIDPVASAMMEGRRDVYRMMTFYVNTDERDYIEADRQYAAQMRDVALAKNGREELN